MATKMTLRMIIDNPTPVTAGSNEGGLTKLGGLLLGLTARGILDGSIIDGSIAKVVEVNASLS